MIETHAHLDFPQYNRDRDIVLKRATEKGVEVIINVASSVEGSFSSVALSNEYSQVFATCGVHPHDAKEAGDKVIEDIKNLILSSKKVVAIGEVGLDFYRNLSPRDDQIKAFVKFINLSKELDLPLILHCREASPGENEASCMLLKLMKDNLQPPFKGVVHCFSGDEGFLNEAISLGLHISFTCNITYKRADDLRLLVRAVPMDRLLLETDSPFLSPQAKRGQRNEPAYLSYLVDELSKNLDVEAKTIEEVTTNNAKILFKI